LLGKLALSVSIKNVIIVPLDTESSPVKYTAAASAVALLPTANSIASLSATPEIIVPMFWSYALSWSVIVEVAENVGVPLSVICPSLTVLSLLY